MENKELDLLVSTGCADNIKKAHDECVKRGLYFWELKSVMDWFELFETFSHESELDLIGFQNSVKHFMQLETLWNKDYTIKKIPQALFNLINLRGLCIHNTEVDTIPKDISKLVNIEVLDLYNNQIKAIPKEIGLLHKLTELVLTNNNLNCVPWELGNLRNLVRIDLSFNSISYLPNGLCSMNKLKELGVEYTDISDCYALIEILKRMGVNVLI